MNAVITGALGLVSGASGVASFLLATVAVLCVPPRNWRLMAGCGAASLIAGAVCLAAAQAALR